MIAILADEVTMTETAPSAASDERVIKFNRYSVLYQALGTIFGAAMFLTADRRAHG